MSRFAEAGHRTFRALSVRNYRLYFTGQVISVSGTWMQMVAQTYLILFRLHGTGVDVAIATGLQFVPCFCSGRSVDLIADRLNKRKVLYATQSSAAVLALLLGLLVITHSIQLWQVFVLASLLGVVNLFDNPGTPDLRLRNGGSRPPAQCREPQQRRHERGPGHRTGDRRGADPHPRRLHLFHRQRRLVHRRHRGALDNARGASSTRAPGVGRSKGQVREGLRYVWSTPTCARRSSPWPSSVSSPSTSR